MAEERDIANLRTMRISDRAVVDNWRKIVGDLGTSATTLKVTSLVPIKGLSDGAVDWKHEPLASVFNQDGMLLQVLRMDIAPNLFLRYSRQLNDADSFSDTINVIVTQQTDGLLAGRLVESVRRYFQTLDRQAINTQLKEHEQATFIQRSSELHQLGEIAETFFKKVTAINEKAEQSLHKRLEELKTESAAEREQNRIAAESERTKIAAERATFEKDKKDFDDRNARIVRRFQRDQLLKTLAIRGKILTRQEASEQTQTVASLEGMSADDKSLYYSQRAIEAAAGKDSPPTTVRSPIVIIGMSMIEAADRLRLILNVRFVGVFAAYVGLLGCIGYLAFKELPTLDINKTPDTAYWVAVGRQIGAGVGFVVTFAFFIRWLNWVMRQHAEKELHYVRLHDDFARANWLVETVSELKEQASDTEVSEIIQLVGHGMFQEKTSEEVSTTALEAIGNAIRGGSIKTTGLEINIPKGPPPKGPKKPKPPLH